MNLLGGGEVDAVDLVDDVAQKVAVDHTIDRTAKDCSNDVTPVVDTGSLQVAQVGEESRTARAIGPYGFFVVDESDEVVACEHGVGVVGPITPAVRRFDSWLEAFARDRGFILAQLLHIVEEFEEEYPGEHGQAVKVSVKAFVFAHDVAYGFDDAAQLLGGGK